MFRISTSRSTEVGRWDFPAQTSYKLAFWFPGLNQLCALLRWTKKNASLILLRDYAELVALYKVIAWKIHIPVRTQKWPRA